MIRHLRILLVVMATFTAATVRLPAQEFTCDIKEMEPKTLFRWSMFGGPVVQQSESVEEEPIATDRPDFTEASSTVGRGIIQLEAGYTFFSDNSPNQRFTSHSYPEALFRIGIVEWLELRVVQNFLNDRTTLNGMTVTSDGADDLSLGVKIALVEQAGNLPEMALILQTTVPTGSDELSANEMLPGTNLLYAWELLDGNMEVGGSTQVNRAVDDNGVFYYEFAQSAVIGQSLTEKLSIYTEYFGFFPTGAQAPGTVATHFVNGGFRYLVTNDFQLDIRFGVGLNKAAEDYFGGVGFSVRF